MDIPLQRTIRIGNATVGLLGLDVALAQLSGKEITEDEAVRFLYDQVNGGICRAGPDNPRPGSALRHLQ